jgi:hypothetical protein
MRSFLSSMKTIKPSPLPAQGTAKILPTGQPGELVLAVDAECLAPQSAARARYRHALKLMALERVQSG